MRKLLVGLFAAFILVFGIYGYSTENNHVEVNGPNQASTEEVNQ